MGNMVSWGNSAKGDMERERREIIINLQRWVSEDYVEKGGRGSFNMVRNPA